MTHALATEDRAEMHSAREAAALTPGNRDFTASLGSFFMLTRDGKLDAIDLVRIEPGCQQFELRPAGINLSILSPLIARVQRSNLSIAIRCDDHPRTQFKMRVSTGPTPRMMNAVGNKTEIITRALDNEVLPIVVQSEIEDRVEAFRRDGSPDATLNIPLRSLEVRKHVPRAIAQLLRDLAIDNTARPAPKADTLKPTLQRIRTSLRETVLCDYMMKCIWLNPVSGQLGNISGSTQGVEFVPFDSDEQEISAFLCALEKDSYGDFLLDFREFGKVIPTPKRTNPWLGPTVHIYKADFRREHELDEQYSLYEGFRMLSTLGAPVLMFKGQNPLLEETEIRFLKISDRSINLLQGRILEGNVLQEGVREFTAQALVWKD